MEHCKHRAFKNLICPVKEFHITRQRPVYFTTELIEYIKERDIVLRLAAQKIV